MRLIPRRKPPEARRIEGLRKALEMVQRDWPTIGLDQWASFFQFGGNQYPLGPPQQTLVGNRKEPPNQGFSGLVQWGLRADAVVFAVEMARLSLFTEARFQFRQLRNGRPGDLFGNQDLQILETPWPNGTTADLLARMLLDADFGGNAFFTRRDDGAGDRLVRLRPDWVTIVVGSDNPDSTAWDLDAELVGYIYQPLGQYGGKDAVMLGPDEVAHFAPMPDPLFPTRGMSWLVPVIQEVAGDQAATEHKLKFFEQGATPNMVVSFDADIKREAFDEAVELFNEGHDGLANAYKTLFLAGGASAQVVGANLRQMEFSNTQGKGETRIAAAANVPPILAHLSEGLQAATYSNYASARRHFGDTFARPNWRNACASLAPLVTVPGGSELWYDDRDIAFLHEDVLDATAARQTQAMSIKTLIDAGFEPNSAVDAVTSGDMSRLLNQHTGLYSVQLQPAGSPDLGAPKPTGLTTASADESPAHVRARERRELDLLLSQK